MRFFGSETDIEKKSFAGLETIPRARSDTSAFGIIIGYGSRETKIYKWELL